MPLEDFHDSQDRSNQLSVSKFSHSSQKNLFQRIIEALSNFFNSIWEGLKKAFVSLKKLVISVFENALENLKVPIKKIQKILADPNLSVFQKMNRIWEILQFKVIGGVSLVDLLSLLFLGAQIFPIFKFFKSPWLSSCFNFFLKSCDF